MEPIMTNLRDGTEIWSIPGNIRYFPSHHKKVIEEACAEEIETFIADEEWVLADLEYRIPHRIGKPAIYLRTEDSYAFHCFENGKLNSFNDHPAFLWYEEERITEQIWARNNQMHREKGPAYILSTNGEEAPFRQAWYTFNEMHRLDGPALIIDPKGSNDKEYYVHGIYFDENEFNQLTIGRTPSEIATAIIKRKQEHAIRHAILSLEIYGEDPEFIEHIKLSLLL